MMNSTQKRTQKRLVLSLIICAISYTGIVYNHAQSSKTPTTEKRALSHAPLNHEEQKSIDNALGNAILYAHDTGKWLEDLFDAEKNVTYIEHVKALKKIVHNIKENFAMPLTPDEDTHPAIKTAHHIALLLLQKVENTYEVLKSYRGSSNHWGLGMALKKVLSSSKNKIEFDAVMQELHVQLASSSPELDAKLNEFKSAISLYSDSINNKSLWTLTNGLWYRLRSK